MTQPILYCGDTELSGAASYLAGLMTAWNWGFDYRPSHQPLTAELLGDTRKLLILSDYPATQIDSALQEQLVQRVQAGMGLLMIGGWESFHGLGGDWDGTPLGNLLPVEISAADDRLNFDQPALVKNDLDHPITDGLPWDARPPVIGGMNQVVAKPGAETLLSVHPFSASLDFGGHFRFEPRMPLPLLVTGRADLGRTAAFLSDVAPHWVGGFVDWGTGRTEGHAVGGSPVEVGNCYAMFWKQLLAWVGDLSWAS